MEIRVATSAELQPALNRAVAGDAVLLASGARFVGQFVLPPKAARVTLRSDTLLPEGRIPADVPGLAVVASGTGAMALDLKDSAHWAVDGLRFEANVGGHGETISILNGQSILLRRLVLVVPEGQQQKRFVLGNGRDIILTQSHCAGVWRTGQDSQCFVAWDGAGPYTITDNFLEGASENVMFGGADSASAANLPADILVENNFFTKRLSWQGQPRNVKNLFELKAAKRVIVRNNIFERNWVDGQSGTAIVFTPRNQDGTAPWSTVEDVLFENNIVRETPSIFNILGHDDIQPSGRAHNIILRNNLLLGTGGRLATIGNEAGSVVFDRNTYVQPQTVEAAMIALYAEGGIRQAGGTSRVPTYAAESLVFTDNLLQLNTYGVHSSFGMGTAALTKMVKTTVWQRNALIGSGGQYPTGTLFLNAPPVPPDYRHPTFGWTGQTTKPTPGGPDPMAELRARVERAEEQTAALEARLDKLLFDLEKTPTATRIAQVVTYLRGLGKR